MSDNTSDSSGHTLADSPTSIPKPIHKKHLSPAEEIEREITEYGADYPVVATKFAPGTAEPKVRDPSQPHTAPNFRQPQQRRLSRSSYRGRPRANTGGSTWSYGDGPSLHVVDSAFADTHRVLSRRSREFSKLVLQCISLLTECILQSSDTRKRGMTTKIARRMSEIRIKSSGRKMIRRIHKST